MPTLADSNSPSFAARHTAARLLLRYRARWISRAIAAFHSYINGRQRRLATPCRYGDAGCRACLLEEFPERLPLATICVRCRGRECGRRIAGTSDRGTVFAGLRKTLGLWGGHSVRAAGHRNATRGQDISLVGRAACELGHLTGWLTGRSSLWTYLNSSETARPHLWTW